MKKFLVMVLASFVGVLIALGLCILFFYMSIGEDSVNVEDNSVLKLSFDVPIVDYNNSTKVDIVSMSVHPSHRLLRVIQAIEHATVDPKIKGIYMDLNDFSLGMTTVEELRRVMADFKQSGKFIIAYADNYSQGSYYLATAADKVYLNPYGSAILTGISPQIMMFTKTLEKLGVEMQVVRHGKFKSAVEPFINKEISPENREQIIAYAGSIWNFVVEEIAKSRSISVEELNRVINNVLSRNAETALEHKLIDGIKYKDEIIAELCQLTNATSEQTLQIIGLSDYIKLSKRASGSENQLAIIYASGEIHMGESVEEVSSEHISRAIRSARNNSKVKAVVFRVNSPGGDAQASEIIARELELTAKEKPVIISMGSLAASGGYWISTPGSVIIANHTTLTGSIGVFGMIPNIQKGMHEFTGITVDVVKTNENSDFLTSLYRPLNSVEKEFLQENVENIYDKFITKVANSRTMSKEAVDSIGQGRVWSGINAYNNGLIDEFGGIREAIAAAASRANITEYRILELPIRKNQLEEIVNTFLTAEVKEYQLNSDLTKLFSKYTYLLNSITQPGVKARMEYEVDLY